MVDPISGTFSQLLNTINRNRSGKIMRRILKELVSTGDVTGNVTTLEDFTVVSNLQKNLKKWDLMYLNR